MGGTALFGWLVWRVGPSEIWTGFRQIGWNLVWIVLLGGLRFVARAAAWSTCIDPPHRLPFAVAFNAVVCGDALGNVTPLGPIVSEPAKIACVRRSLPVGPALTALAIENLFYTLSVAAMIAAGAIALLVTGTRGGVALPAAFRQLSEATVAVIAVAFAVVAWALWRRPQIVSTLFRSRPVSGSADQLESKTDRLRSLERQVLTFASRRKGTLLPLILFELSFHVLGVAEKYLTLWFILPSAPTILTAFIVEAADRFVTVAFKFVPFQIGVGEVGTGLATQLLGFGAASGVTISIVRKARMGLWSLIGMALLVRQGLSARRVLDDPELNG